MSDERMSKFPALGIGNKKRLSELRNSMFATLATTMHRLSTLLSILWIKSNLSIPVIIENTEKPEISSFFSLFLLYVYALDGFATLFNFF